MVVPTEGRIFVARLTRDLNARQAAGARLLSPGQTRWEPAFAAFACSFRNIDGPVKAAKVFQAALARLKRAQREHGACSMNCYMRRSRSGYLEVLTYDVAPHPLTKTSHDGIAVPAYFVTLRRTGRIAAGVSTLAFLSWHSLGRMWERAGADVFSARGILAACGIAGLLMRQSKKHIGTEVNVAVGDALVTGVLRHATADDGQLFGFLDVLTTVPPEHRTYAQKFAQGCAIADAVLGYLNADDASPAGYADDIPVLPFHEADFVSRELRASTES